MCHIALQLTMEVSVELVSDSFTTNTRGKLGTVSDSFTASTGGKYGSCVR